MAFQTPEVGFIRWRKVAPIACMFLVIFYLHHRMAYKAKSNMKSLTETNQIKAGYRFEDDEYVPGKEFVKAMTKHAWRGYREHAWGKDELNPLSKAGSNFYGHESLALTVIDSLDTLLITGLHNEYAEARDFALNVNFDHEMKISMFEANIRIVGGFLSAFALTGEGKFVSRAFDVANRFLGSFTDDYPLRDVDLMG